jgi:hypothetical protein
LSLEMMSAVDFAQTGTAHTRKTEKLNAVMKPAAVHTAVDCTIHGRPFLP